MNTIFSNLLIVILSFFFHYLDYPYLGLMEEHQSKNMDVTRGIVRRFKAKPEKEDFVTINV